MATSSLPMVGPSGVTSVGAVAGGKAENKDTEALKKAAKAFEAVFVRQIMKEMRSSGFGDDLTGSNSVEQFQEMADARTADTLADKGGFGIAEALMKQLAPKQAKAAYAAQAAEPGKKD